MLLNGLYEKFGDQGLGGRYMKLCVRVFVLSVLASLYMSSGFMMTSSVAGNTQSKADETVVAKTEAEQAKACMFDAPVKDAKYNRLKHLCIQVTQTFFADNKRDLREKFSQDSYIQGLNKRMDDPAYSILAEFSNLQTQFDVIFADEAFADIVCQEIREILIDGQVIGLLDLIIADRKKILRDQGVPSEEIESLVEAFQN